VVKSTNEKKRKNFEMVVAVGAPVVPCYTWMKKIARTVVAVVEFSR
jgi:hypothetical protein